MKAKEISNLFWFCQSVAFGGFASASLHTRVSAPTLSRAVSQLEEQLGEKLIHRNAKTFQLTAVGEEYYQRFAPTFSQLNDDWQTLSDQQTSLSGDIHISCPEPFADYFLQQVAIEFMALHPNVNIKISFASDTEHFFEDQVDLAISTSPPKNPNLVQRQLFDTELSLAASAAYIAAHGEPTNIEELLEHKLLSGNTKQVWEFKQNDNVMRIPVKPKYSVNSLRLSIQAACQGVGICLIPKAALYFLVEECQLEDIMPDVECMSGFAYLVWADRTLTSARVLAFKDLIFSRMKSPHELLSSISTSRK